MASSRKVSGDVLKGLLLDDEPLVRDEARFNSVLDGGTIFLYDLLSAALPFVKVWRRLRRRFGKGSSNG